MLAHALAHTRACSELHISHTLSRFPRARTHARGHACARAHARAHTTRDRCADGAPFACAAGAPVDNDEARATDAAARRMALTMCDGGEGAARGDALVRRPAGLLGCARQLATRDMLRATCNRRHATDDQWHDTCSRHNAWRVQQAACTTRHAPTRMSMPTRPDPDCYGQQAHHNYPYSYHDYPYSYHHYPYTYHDYPCSCHDNPYTYNDYPPVPLFRTRRPRHNRTAHIRFRPRPAAPPRAHRLRLRRARRLAPRRRTRGSCCRS